MRIEYHKERAIVFEREPLIAGTVGKTVNISFREGWRGRVVTLVFKAGFTSIDVELSGTDGQRVEIPWEVMEKASASLQVGAEGTATDGTVLRSEYADLGPVRSGATPQGEPPSKATPTPVQQLKQMLGNLEELNTETKENFVAAVNELLGILNEGIGGEEPGEGIASLEQTTVSSESGGVNIWTATLTDGTISEFAVKNGAEGPQGDTGASGEDGVGIDTIEIIEV